MGEKLRLTSVVENGIVTIYCSGALVFTSAIDFKTELKPWLTADIKEMILDLEKVTQIDSAGLGLIAQTLNHAAARSLTFRVTQIPAAIQATFEMTGLSARLARKKTGGS